MGGRWGGRERGGEKIGRREKWEGESDRKEGVERGDGDVDRWREGRERAKRR